MAFCPVTHFITRRYLLCPSLHFETNQSKLHSRHPKATKVAMSNKTSYWASVDADVKAHLEQVLPRNPLEVHQSVREVVFSAPSSMAPALCVAVCELYGGLREDALVVASAINLELAANYTRQHLTHLQKRQSLQIMPHNIKLLSGIAIFSLGFELLCSSDSMRCDPTKMLKVITEIAHAVGAEGAVEVEFSRVRKGGEVLKSVSEEKEVMIYACAAACGAIVGRANEEEIERLKRIGFYVGMICGTSTNGIRREETEELRSMALKELEGFDVGKISDISSLFEGAN